MSYLNPSSSSLRGLSLPSVYNVASAVPKISDPSHFKVLCDLCLPREGQGCVEGFKKQFENHWWKVSGLKEAVQGGCEGDGAECVLRSLGRAEEWTCCYPADARPWDWR